MKLIFKIESLKRFLLIGVLLLAILVSYEVHTLFAGTHEVILKSSLMYYGYALGALIYFYFWLYLTSTASKLRKHWFYSLLVAGLLFGLIMGASVAGIAQKVLIAKGYESSQLDVIYSVGDWSYYHKTYILK